MNPRMRLGMLASRRPVCIDREASVAAASRLMREQRVGELVVTELLNGKQVAAGIVSARDIVTRVLALGLDARAITIGDLVWSRAAAAHVTDSLSEALARLCASGGDALALLGADGKVAAILSLDDLLSALGSGPGTKDGGLFGAGCIRLP